MSIRKQLVGKTISGIVGVQDGADQPARIWMLQFTDGSHVEFVSPTARRRIHAATRGRTRHSNEPENDSQLALYVA